MKARPKTFVTYTVQTFNGDAEVWVHCWPQQKWDYLEDRGKVILSRKNMSMSLQKEEIEKHWKVVEE